MQQTTALIIGASVSGLAAAACLQKRRIKHIIIEKEAQIAMPWRNHYVRLHLHTTKGLSHLPYKKFGRNIPRYPSRQQVVDYLEEYRKKFAIHPAYNTEAKQIKKVNDKWIIKTSNGDFESTYIIVATGVYGKPKNIFFKGIETFQGAMLHSAFYKTGCDFAGQNVLVVGFGNSACEIAIDLYECDAKPSMSVRSPVNIIPRDLLGVSILRISLLMSKLPPRLADTIASLLMRLLFGNISKLGLKKKTCGVFEQIQKESVIPLIDIGTIKHIRQGHIAIYDDISCIEGNTVYFTHGKQKKFDAIVAAIGYERNFTEIIEMDNSRLNDLRMSINQQQYFGKDGLYFCGFHISATGLIREISSDAQKIAKDIAGKENNR